MAERLQRNNFTLNTIPYYDGNVNSLNVFINAVELVWNLLRTLQPELDVERLVIFLSVRSKIVGKALDSIKDVEITGWDHLKENLLSSFAVKSTFVTILNEILNINNTKIQIYFDSIKSKFNKYRAKLIVEEEEEVKRTAVLNFVEKLVILHYITNVNDPFRNNLATRNSKTLNEIETLLQNDLHLISF